MTDPPPVTRWDTDFDVLSPDYVADPFGIWDELRRTCPVAHTDRRGSTWLPTRYQDVVDLAHDVGHFSSTEITVIPFAGERPPPFRRIRRCTPGPGACSCRGSPTGGWMATSR
jgi:hypothetical protein